MSIRNWGREVEKSIYIQKKEYILQLFEGYIVDTDDSYYNNICSLIFLYSKYGI